MAKMFYSKEEVEEKLGMSGDQLDQLVADGKLREFRDGAKKMFKVDEVDAFNPDAAVDAAMESGELGLAPLSDTNELNPPTIDDSSDELSLAGDSDPGLGGESSEIGLAPLGDSADALSLEDSDSDEMPLKDDTVVTEGLKDADAEGINVLEDSDEGLDLADPMAQTQIAPDFADQVALDAGSSGSGLLDLTREADDTSLGAEVLDDIYPAGDEGAVETQLPTAFGASSRAPETADGAGTSGSIIEAEPVVQYVEAAAVVEPGDGLVATGFILSFVVLIYLAFVAAAGIADVQPAWLSTLSGNIANMSITFGGIGLAALFMVMGYMSRGKAMIETKEKAKKAKKVKSPKEKKARRKKK